MVLRLQRVVKTAANSTERGTPPRNPPGATSYASADTLPTNIFPWKTITQSSGYHDHDQDRPLQHLTNVQSVRVTCQAPPRLSKVRHTTTEHFHQSGLQFQKTYRDRETTPRGAHKLN